MSTADDATPIPFPAWVREITTLLRITSLFLLHGNTRDMYLSPQLEVHTLATILRAALAGEGIEEIAVVRAAGGNEATPAAAVWDQGVAWGTATAAASPVPEAPVGIMGDLVRRCLLYTSPSPR